MAHAASTTARATHSSALLPALFAAFIGVGAVFTVGFANSAALHDAAHDARHSVSFPCH